MKVFPKARTDILMYFISLYLNIFKTELLLWAFCFPENHAFSNTEILLSQNRSKNINVSRGIRLVNYTEILNNDSGRKIASLLEDGKSAWIGGYANFSSVVAEHGCINKTSYQSNLDPYTLDTANLDFCVRKCLRRKANPTYVGIENKHCVCFDNKERKLLTNKFVDSSNCHFPCSNLDISLCGGSNYMSLYRIIKNNEMLWAKHRPGPKQCINVQIKNDTGVPRFSASTDSCFTFNRVRGYICTNSLFSTLDTEKCNKTNSDRKYCLVRNKATRLEAFDDCLKDKHGTLAEYFGEEHSVKLMDNDRRYWISVFRTFQPTHQFVSKERVCLAVTKLSGKLYLEPGSCKTRKHFLYREMKISTRSDPDKNNLPLTTGIAETSSASDKHRNLTDINWYTSNILTLTNNPTTSLKPETTFNVLTANKSTTSISDAVADKDTTTSEVTEPYSGSGKHWSVTNDAVSGTDCDHLKSSPKPAFNPVSTINLQKSNDRYKSYKPEFASNNNDRVYTPSQMPVSHLRTVSIDANKNLDTHGISMIVYILPSSLLLIFGITVVALVIYLRKTKRQLKFQSRSKSNPGTASVLNSDTDQNVRTHFSESSLPNNFQHVERNPKNNEMKFGIHALQEDEYDKIKFAEIKPNASVDTDNYDHAFHGAGNRYNNTDDTRPPFMYSLAKDVTTASSFHSKKVEVEPKTKMKQGKTYIHNIPTANSNSTQDDDMHIYNVLIDENSEYSSTS